MRKTYTAVERIRRCKYCGSDMTDKYSPEGYASNPFCNDCFNKRVQEGPLPRKGWFVLVGKYFHFVPDKSEEAGRIACEEGEAKS